MEIVSYTPVTRSWRNTFLRLLFGVIFAAAGVLLVFLRPDPAGILIALLCVLMCVAVIWAAIANSYTGACPTCGAVQKAVGGMHRCGNCLAYGEIVERQYRQMQPDCVLNAPLFAALIPEPCYMPKLCTGCGMTSTRSERLRIIRTEFAFDLEVPFCDLHRGTAELGSEIAEGRKHPNIPVLRVASYRFYREFLKLNGRGVE